MTHTTCGNAVNEIPISSAQPRPPIRYARRKGPRGNDVAPLQVHQFTSGMIGLNLEQRGFVISLLNWHWDTGLMPPDDFKEFKNFALRTHFGGDARQLNRIWSEWVVKQAFDNMRRQRQPVPEDRRERVWNKTGGYCWHCGCALTQEHRKSNSFHVDHLKLVRFGGTSHIDNLVPACRSCNLKRSKLLDIQPTANPKWRLA